MRWTPGAKIAVEHALIRADHETVGRAITYAEELAEYLKLAIVDTDIWIQALIHVKHERNDQMRDAS
jgi:hypothetical protein